MSATEMSDEQVHRVEQDTCQRDTLYSRPLYLGCNLSKLVPTIMLASRWRQFDALPRNINARLDWRAVRDRFQAGFQMLRTAACSTTGV